jgi:hypothetical protein
MLAGVLVNTMIAIVEAIIELPASGNGSDGAAAGQALADIKRVAEKQLRLPLLAIPYWKSGTR